MTWEEFKTAVDEMLEARGQGDSTEISYIDISGNSAKWLCITEIGENEIAVED